jgi:hypothetical protein
VVAELRRVGCVKTLVPLLAPTSPPELLVHCCIALGSCAAVGTPLLSSLLTLLAGV